MAKDKRSEGKGAVDLKQLKVGDVVAIEWHDVHAYERIGINELDDLK